MTKQFYPEIKTDYLKTGKGVEDRKCNNFNDRKNSGFPIWIINHHTEVSFQETIDRFLSKTIEISAHYVIDIDGAIYQFVADEKRAWHSGIGSLKANSKLNPNIEENILKNDMNSWSIGIEHINNGNSPFPKKQILASIYLHEYLVNKHHINPKMILAHAEWSPGRKIDPSPYFDWPVLANAVQIEGITHNFGIYPTIKSKRKPEVIISSKSACNHKDKIAELQKKFEKLGYLIITADASNLGYYDKILQNVCLSFKIRYMSRDIIYDPYKLSLWGKISTCNPKTATLRNKLEIAKAADILSSWNENDDSTLDEVLKLY